VVINVVRIEVLTSVRLWDSHMDNILTNAGNVGLAVPAPDVRNLRIGSGQKICWEQQNDSLAFSSGGFTATTGIAWLANKLQRNEPYFGALLRCF
jgi:hypothetical protein